MLRFSRRCLSNVLLVAQADAKGCTAATLSSVTAAQKLGDVTAVCIGDAAAVAKVPGVSKVLQCKAPHCEHELAENIAETVKKIHAATPFSHIVLPSSAMGRGVAPRLGAALDVQPISDVLEVHDGETFTRGTYAGNALTKVKSTDPVKVMTIRGASFDKAAADGGSAAVEDVAAADDTGLTKWVEDQTHQTDKPDLASASTVVSGGRGLKEAKNFDMLEKLADKLGAAVGATRAVVDAGWVPNDMQVGQTGKVVAPTLYIACGLSGAIQHVAGMKDSKTIVAINTDDEAPIMALADYGLVEDVFTAVPALIEKL
eukprot:TRINITY_DN6045_c5_g1_i1.p1 TRINITY_DN6045_c5_g1~~TRINITY_DN6045_c5_g1_i1.p1  ORF type:complete len:315 (+),score=111.67 TRINITY_DN6045_c5_g1_i1:98-1042(+)